MHKNNPRLERFKRVEMAYLLATFPQTYEALSQNKINLFHGTNSNALQNILKYGMNSVDKATENGINVTTGEEWSRIGGKRDFISFTNNLDVALDYSSIGVQMQNGQEGPFNVIIGLSENNIDESKIVNVQSDLPEIGIKDSIPKDKISFIGVPENKVEFVKKLTHGTDIIVAPIDTSEKFYYRDDFEDISFDIEKANKILENREKTTTSTFSIDDAKNLMKTRKKSDILSIKEKISNFIKSKFKKKGEKNAENQRDE